jgi:MFS family permease
LAVLAAIGFVWRIRSVEEPFVEPALFNNSGFLAAVGVGFFMMFANVGTLVLIPFVLSELNGASAAGIGLVLAPGAAAVAILSPVAGRLSDQFGPRALIRTGLLVMMLSTLGLSTFGVGASSVSVALGVLGLGVGFSLANSPIANAAAATLSSEESGVGLGIFQLVFFLGGGFGPAVAATFLAFRQDVGGSAINPLHSLGAAPFSDAFLLIALSAAMALVATVGIGRKSKEPPKKPG